MLCIAKQGRGSYYARGRRPRTEWDAPPFTNNPFISSTVSSSATLSTTSNSINIFNISTKITIISNITIITICSSTNCR